MDFHGMWGGAPGRQSAARRASAPASFVGEKLARAGLAKRDQLRRGGDVGGLAGRQGQGQRHSICRRAGRGSWSRPRRRIGSRHSNGCPFSGPGAHAGAPLSRLPACAAGQRDHGAVDHLDRPIPGAASSERRHDFLMEPGARSSCKPAPHSVPFAEARGQIAPGRAGPGDPEDALQDLPVVDRRAAGAPADRRQKRREQRPGPRRR